MGMSPVWCCRPAPAISKPGSTSAPLRSSLPWPPKLAESWRVSIEAIRPASTGAIWVGSPASPIKNRSVAGPAALTLLGQTAACPSWLGHTRRRAGRCGPTPAARQHAGSSLPRPARWLAHRPRRRSHLSGLVELVADSTTISADRLEYRRQVDRPGVAVPQNAAGPSASYPPTGQPWLSPPPFRPRRLPAPHRRPSPRRARKAAFSRATPSPMRLPDSLHAPCVQAGRLLHLFPRLRWLGEALDGRRAGSLTWHSRHVPLKVRRRPISQGRVHPFAVVVISHEFLDMFGKFLEIPILVAVDLFLLQRFHEAFTERVVIGIGRAAHARDHSVGLEFRYVIGAGVLDPLVGVMDNTRWWLPFSDGLP